MNGARCSEAGAPRSTLKDVGKLWLRRETQKQQLSETHKANMLLNIPPNTTLSLCVFSLTQPPHVMEEIQLKHSRQSMLQDRWPSPGLGQYNTLLFSIYFCSSKTWQPPSPCLPQDPCAPDLCPANFVSECQLLRLLFKSRRYFKEKETSACTQTLRFR